jgi:hypothetical protein
MSDSTRKEGFGAFFKRYTRTWHHAVATAALTAFGTLTFVHRLFAVLAILAYLVPPVVLYLRSGGRGEEEKPEQETRPTDPVGESDVGSGSEGGTESERESEDDPREGWTRSHAPGGASLTDVTLLDGDAYAVGAEGTVLTDRDGGWRELLADGPGAEGRTLRGVDATDEGVWFAGDGGALGRLDAESNRHVDHSGPDGDTSGIADVAAAGPPGDETVLLVDGSGRVRRGRYDGGGVTWEEPVTPGSGSSFAAVSLDEGSTGYACDTNQSVFEAADGGRFSRVGIDGATGTLTDVSAGERVRVSDDAGVIYRREDGRWTPERVGEGAVWALSTAAGRTVASADGGVVHCQGSEESEWDSESTPAKGSLTGVAMDGVRAVAVGESGDVVERRVDPR